MDGALLHEFVGVGDDGWIEKNPIPLDLSYGLGLTIINNMAIIAEGIITDLIQEYIKHSGTTLHTNVNFDIVTWGPKKKIYNGLFAKKIEDYTYYKSVEVLFAFRNNVAHGRSDEELSSIDPITGKKEMIQSENDKYEMIRNYFIEKGLMKHTDTSNNVDFIWKMTNAIYLMGQVKIFLKEVLIGNDSTFKQGIQMEWDLACESR